VAAREGGLPMIVLRALALVLLLLAAAGCTEGPGAEGRYSLTVVTQGEHTFGADQVSVGPLVVAGGDVHLQAGADHRGELFALAGQVRLEGRVDGDVLALGADIVLEDGAVVTGDLRQAGGTVVRSAGSTVQGQVTETDDVGQVFGGQGEAPTLLDRLIWWLVTVVALAGPAWLLTRVAPRPVDRVRRASTGHPVVSGALGTLVLVMTPALVVSMVFTLFLIPLALVVAVLLGGVVAYGLVGLAHALGAGVVRRTGWSLRAPGQAALGTGVLVSALHLVALLPVLGVLVLAVVAAVATGAVLLTGLGTRTYTPPPNPDDVEDMEETATPSTRPGSP
jgi:hypothetical protein